MFTVLAEYTTESFGNNWFYTYTYRASAIACPFVAKSWGKLHDTLLTPASKQHTPESNVHGANMGPIWDRQDPGGSHVGPMNFGIWDPLPYSRVLHKHLLNIKF